MTRKGIGLLIVSIVLACLCLVGTTLPALAAPAQRAVSANQLVQTIPAYQKGRDGSQSRPWRSFDHGGSGSELNQYFGGNTNHDNPITSYGGHGLGDSGNVGHNRGFNQDNTFNGGNQILLSDRLRAYRRINQYYDGNNNYRNPIVHRGGYDKGNTGNVGLNDGTNQDNSGNDGNQVAG